MNPVIAALIAGAVCLVLGVGVGMILRKMLAESKIGTAEKQAERVREEAEKLRERAKDMVAEGRKQAETLKKEAVLAAQKDSSSRMRWSWRSVTAGQRSPARKQS